MTIILTYKHTRNLFLKNRFKPFVNKYFDDAKFIGCESGNWSPRLSVCFHSWENTKYILPKYAIPIKIEWGEMNVLEALAFGQLPLYCTRKEQQYLAQHGERDERTLQRKKRRHQN